MNFEYIREKAIAEWQSREESSNIRICVSTGAWERPQQMPALTQIIDSEIANKNIHARIIEVGSLGIWSVEPLIYIAKTDRPHIVYRNATPEIVSLLMTDYVVGDNPHQELALCTFGKERIDGIPDLAELPMFKLQTRIAMRNCGFVNPTDINDYIVQAGYSGLAKALAKTREEVISEIDSSGLRGRGGAGFSTAAKLRCCLETAGNVKYLVCNAAAGDPDSAGESTLLQGDPHSVLEGMIIGAYAAGASFGYILVNSGFKTAISRLNIALRQMRENGLLGDNILGSGFKFDVEVRDIADTAICGEETALIRILEGKRGMPYPRPPYPSISGIDGNPTLINSVETFANLSAIIQMGSEWYGKFGTVQSRGTKMLTISGKVIHKGVIEVPMGTTLRQIVYEVAGGINQDKEFKGAQIGGSAGGCLPANALDTAIDYESLAAVGIDMGSGSIVIADNDVCMVDLCKHYQSLNSLQSCGECVLCREGTMQIVNILEDITGGKGKTEDIDFLLELGETLKLGSLCNLGRTSPNPVITAISNFREEFMAHVSRKRCPAKICSRLVSFHILGENCTGCEKCAEACPANAIAGGKEMIHVIDQNTCIKCGACHDACPSYFAAVVKVSGKKPETPDKPIPAGTWGKS